MTPAGAKGTTFGFNPSVHGARGLFALMVFAFHVSNSGLSTFYSDAHWLNRMVFGSFKFGVELFFAISGFVIVGALLRAPSPRAFLWDRATRIYPLLWTTLAAITLMSLATGRWLPPFGDWLLNFLAPPPLYDLPQVNPAAWSLGYEVGFYALAAACAWAGRRGWRWRPAAIILGTLCVIAWPRALLMPAGVVIAAGLFAKWLPARLTGAPGLWLILFLLLWRQTELAAPGQDIARLTPDAAAWITALPLMIAAGLAGTLAMRGIVAGQGVLAAVLRTRPIQWLGTISYSFYLWHPVVMAAVKAGLISSGLAGTLGPGAQLAFALLSLPPALALSQISQIWIERRLTRWLRHHGPKEDRAGAPITTRAPRLPI